MDKKGFNKRPRRSGYLLMKHDQKEKVLKLLEKNYGIVTPNCKEAGISRDCFYRWKQEDPDFKRRVDEIDDITLDFVEKKLLDKIASGHDKAIMFYMRYKARKRGYIDSSRTELSGDIKADVTIKVVYEDEDKNEE